MLRDHVIRRTFDEFEEVYQYHLINGTLIETNKELKEGQIIFISDVSDYVITVKSVWDEYSKRYFTYDTAEDSIVRARIPRKEKGYL